IVRFPRFRGYQGIARSARRDPAANARSRTESRCPSGRGGSPASERGSLAVTTSVLPLERSDETFDFAINELLDPLAELGRADIRHHAREARVARSPAHPRQMLTVLGEGHPDAFQRVAQGLHRIDPVAVQDLGAAGPSDLERR